MHFRSSNNPGSETSWPNCSTEEHNSYDFNNDPYLQQPHDFNTSITNGGSVAGPYPISSALAQNYAYNFFDEYNTIHKGNENTPIEEAIVIASGTTVISNDPLILTTTTTDSISENGSIKGVLSGNGAGRIMREIIV